MTGRALLILLCWIAAPAAAQRSLAIERFDARITVNADGTIDVLESIRAKFTGSWNGIYRKVPVEYRTAQGFKWTVRLDLVSATDAEGQPLRTETSREGHFIQYKMWIPGAVDAVRSVVLRYRVHNALRFFEDHDELYWNVTGDEWDVALGDVSAAIELPAGATGVRATAFNGVYGSTSREAEVALEGAVVRITMPRKLEFREGLTAVVGWDKGLVPEPTRADRVAGFLGANWPLALPIPVLLGMLFLWSRRGRDPRQLPISVQYEPPPGLTPAEAGTLTDESADMRDITATIVDLAVRGHLKIEEREESKLFGLVKNKEFVFHRTTPKGPPLPLQRYESEVLEGIFKDGAREVELSDLQNEFYKYLGDIKSGIMDRLVQQGLYARRPDHVRGRWIGLGVALGFIIAMGGGGLASEVGLAPMSFVVAGIAIGLIVIIVGYHMPARTVAGARTLEKVLGFSEFLERVDKERFETVVKTPEMFERYLPYAMAFGVEKKWAAAFKDIYLEPPTWYAGSSMHGFNASLFSTRLSDMSTRASSTMSSSPRSSSGSGFSGGSSGGGGGGGGGGGF
jgi:predicted membrane protein DUF2207